MASTRGHLLAPEHLASVASAIELVSAMWSGTDELEMSAADERTVQLLADYLQLGLDELATPRAQHIKDSIGDAVVLALKVGVRSEQSLVERRVRVNVEFRLRAQGWSMWTSTKEAPAWLDRDAIDRVNAILSTPTAQESEEEEEDVVASILARVEEVSEFLLTIPSATETEQEEVKEEPESTHVRRTWYYLPSLSTKSKRDDICTLASTSTPRLTGFLLAGKPGLIVIEHPLSTPSPTDSESQAASSALDAFWSTIKRESWSDIPSSHKKISQRLVEPSTGRAFSTFDDVTDWPELERAAERGRRSDLSKLIRWLDARGIAGTQCLESVLGVGSWDA
ncbi:hypothetical protein PANT_13d00037 [Moesziomyces antarcticus T-34]|uniref:Uncharacterized protein n=1 Tax=Pseudozyma antarctica (strain T-34) TaxID=1151754 RepID=M9M3I7_PSEA3|nr:hypothetical protein PANT_13d00037 [Moesziomyces antarcticus T-34]